MALTWHSSHLRNARDRDPRPEGRRSSSSLQNQRARDPVADRLLCRDTLQCMPTPGQEAGPWRPDTLRLPLDDPLVVMREFLNSNAARSGLRAVWAVGGYAGTRDGRCVPGYVFLYQLTQRRASVLERAGHHPLRRKRDAVECRRVDRLGAWPLPTAFRPP